MFLLRKKQNNFIYALLSGGLICSKFSNIFSCSGFNKMLNVRAGIHKMLVTIANRSSLIWVCTICLGLFGRQIVFEILEHLPYILCARNMEQR